MKLRLPGALVWNLPVWDLPDRVSAIGPIMWWDPSGKGLIQHVLWDMEWGWLDFLVIDSPPWAAEQSIEPYTCAACEPSQARMTRHASTSMSYPPFDRMSSPFKSSRQASASHT